MMLNDDNIHTRFECTKVPFPSEVRHRSHALTRNTRTASIVWSIVFR